VEPRPPGATAQARLEKDWQPRLQAPNPRSRKIGASVVVPEGVNLYSGLCVLAGALHEGTDDRSMTPFENRLAAELCMQSHVSMWACDAEFRVVLWNRGAEDIYGYPAEAVIGKRYLELFVDEDERDNSAQNTRNTITTGIRFKNLLGYDHDPTGKVRQMLINCFRITDPATGERYLAEVGIEISDLELRKDEDRMLRELGIARRAARRSELQRRRDEIVFRVGRLRDELSYVRGQVLRDLEAFAHGSRGKTRADAEAIQQRESAWIATEYRNVELELQNIKLVAETAATEAGIQEAEQALGSDPSVWTDRLRSGRQT
jgi:PAS domain S-box-containing protein